MNISPREAPFYGGGEITVQLRLKELPDEELNYYLSFKGLNERHTTFAQSSFINSFLQLNATIPSHSRVEDVELCVWGVPRGGGRVVQLASTDFHYGAADSAHQLAAFLLACVQQPEHLRRLSECGEVESRQLDERLTTAFASLRLPRTFNLVGCPGDETLVHLCGRLGLSRFFSFLVGLPGGRSALSTHNHHALLPEEVAAQHGFHELARRMQQFRQQGTPTSPPPLKSEDFISTDLRNGNHPLIEDDIRCLEKRFSNSEYNENKKETNGEAVEDREPPARVLEDNLRRIRDIHEGIQKLRQINNRQIVTHCPKDETQRLTSSCPSLYMTSGDEMKVRLDGVAMRNVQQQQQQKRRTSLSQSLDSAFVEPFQVKIHVNDLTPSPSQECLSLLCSPLSESDCSYSGGRFSYESSKKSNIGGTTSKRLAKRSSKKTPERRQSWSSVGADSKQPIQRRWSLSSLDSDTEDTFCKSNTTASFRSKKYFSKNINLSQLSREKIRNFSDGSCDDSPLSSKQSSSVPTIGVTSAGSKENVEPQKTYSVGSLSICALTFLDSFKNPPLQKSLSTPTISVEDTTAKAESPVHNRQSSCTMPQDSPECDPSFTSLIRDVQMLQSSAAADSDEEKVFVKRKKRSSIFFKKKPDKSKGKKAAAHQYIVFSGSLNICDVCQKGFNKKQALKCENCLVVVHDSACKDQVIDCNKFKLQRAQSAKSSCVSLGKEVNCNGNSMNQGKGSLPANSRLNFPVPHSSIPLLGEAASRSSFINLNKMFSEEKDTEGGGEHHSNITEINSASMESDLDEGAAEISDLEDNHILRLMDDEPETWNAAVDKKVIKKLKDREIKRQETIHELIITEKHHCLTLQIMQKVYSQGMMKELGASRELVDRLFPCLNDLVELHRMFLWQLRERQAEGPIIEKITDVLQDQFQDQRAEHMKRAYGQFCSQHMDSLNLYKEMLKGDRKFANFVKKCKSKRLCKTRGIPECLLLVTQRITKYILVIESLIKASKDNKEEQEALEQILCHVKDVISSVDFQVAEKEKEIKLLEIFNKMDAKTTLFYRGKKFKKTDLLACNRKLRKEGPVAWISPRGKTIDVLAVLLSDYMFFFTENNQKLFFASLENKPGVVSLQKLLTRKKAGQDSRGIYLISSNPNEPEMVELLCRNPKEQRAWMEAIREATELCPADEQDEGLPSETEEERKLEAARNAQIKQLTSLLHEKDLHLAQMCEEKMRIYVDLLEIMGVDAECFENVKYMHLVENAPNTDTKELISSAITSASRLASNLYTSGTNLSRSVSSAGERQSETYVSPLLPKRAETFGGFDNPTKEQLIPIKVPMFKRKLLHLKEQSESKTKGDSTNMGESLESALQNFGLQTTLSITGKMPNVCNSPDKQQGKKPSPGAPQPPDLFREVNSEVLHLTATPLLVSQGKEQLMHIIELAHHLNTVVCTVSHLSSSFESVKVQLAESENKLSKSLREARDKKPVYRPEHQLEELRNLQKQLNHDRSAWQQEKQQFETQLKAQREELEKMQEQLKTEQMDVTHQRELLYRKLDALQKQGIILSPSHNVVNLNVGATREEEASPDGASTDFTHRRTVSYDLGQTEEHIPFVTCGSSSAAPSHRIDSKNRPSLNMGVGAKMIPLHLSNSATNVQKRPSVSIKQQLPLKLANVGHLGGSAPTPMISPQGGPQQVLPMKLALGPGGQVLNESKNPPKRSHSAASSPSATLAAPVHVRGGSSPALVQTPTSPKYKAESSILHHLKLGGGGDRSKKKDDGNEEIFC